VSSLTDTARPVRALSYYVFVGAWLVKGFTVMGMKVGWHTETILCPSDNIPQALRQQLDEQIEGRNLPYELDWRSLKDRNIACKSVFFGGGNYKRAGSGIVTGTVHLHSNRHLMRNTEGCGHKYLYGRIDPTDIFQKFTEMYQQKIGCVGSWRSNEYSVLSYNCNAFTQHLIGCKLGLEHTLPGMAIYGTYSYKCKC
jgi:hypothetical protein